MFCLASSVQAQGDSIRLSTLQQDAQRIDPRTKQFDLQAAQSALRLRNVNSDRLPSFLLQGQGQYQSDVTSITANLPPGIKIPDPRRNTYDAHLGIQQRILDPTRSPKRSAERAQLAEAQARVKTALFNLRQEVNETFFAAVLLQERMGVIDAVITDLELRLKETESRVKEGVALPGDVASLKAAILQRRQDRMELRSNRVASLAVLSELTGRKITETTPLAVPNLSTAVSQTRTDLSNLRARPEYEQFSSVRERLSKQTALVSAQEKPRLSAFGRTGYGRPGLNMLNTEFDAYWLAGLQVQWAPWNWGSANREREVIALQQQVVSADESAFTEALRRGIQRDLATIERIDSALVLDDEIIALREQVDKEAQVRLKEGVITAADYLNRNTEVLQSRLARAARRVERAQARARVLTTLGVEIR